MTESGIIDTIYVSGGFKLTVTRDGYSHILSVPHVASGIPHTVQFEARHLDDLKGLARQLLANDAPPEREGAAERKTLLQLAEDARLLVEAMSHMSIESGVFAVYGSGPAAVPILREINDALEAVGRGLAAIDTQQTRDQTGDVEALARHLFLARSATITSPDVAARDVAKYAFEVAEAFINERDRRKGAQAPEVKGEWAPEGKNLPVVNNPCSMHPHVVEMPYPPVDFRTRDGIQRIADEREQQVKKWSAGHDDTHDDGALAVVAAILATSHTDASVHDHDVIGEDGQDEWGLRKKHKDTVRRLEIAGSLIAAEIDRINRRRGVR